MLKKNNNRGNGGNKQSDYEVVCSWCGAVIRSDAVANEEQMCLICHARMLNDYFQRLRKVSDERRASRRF